MKYLLIENMKRRFDEFVLTYEPDVTCVVGVPRGGLPIAVYASHRLDVPLVFSKTEAELAAATAGRKSRVLLVDDVLETGQTLAGQIRLYNPEYVWVWCLKGQTNLVDGVQYGRKYKADKWLVMPWEQLSKAKQDKDAYYASR